MAKGISSITVVQMIETDGPGGAEETVFRLSEELRTRGHRLVPLGPADGEGWLSGRFREAKFERGCFRIRRALDPSGLQEMIQALRASRADVVHSHEFTCAVYGTVATRWLGVPHIITMHGDVGVTDVWRRRAALRWAFRHSAATVAVSDATLRAFRARLSLSGEALSVIRNGVPFPKGDPAPICAELDVREGEFVVLSVGNLYPVKGHRVLLDALVQLGAHAFRWRLVIAGRGSERATLMAHARECGVAERIHLLGLRSDVPDLLAAADVYAMPSHQEGLPLALLEAMLAGKPIVASAVGGIPEAIEHGKQGLLVPAGAVGDLANALKRLFVDSGERARLGAAARARAEREFTIASMTDRYENCYRGALGEQERSAT